MARELKLGDRVTMVSGMQSFDGSDPPKLVGTVEAWDSSGRMLVVWDDWPCVTPLPNANVHLVGEESN